MHSLPKPLLKPTFSRYHLDDLMDAIDALTDAIKAQLESQPLTDVVAPIATIVLAIAALVVAYFSWQTATRANSLTQEHRSQDRAEKDARFRRGIAVDVRAWIAEASWRAKFGAYYVYDDDAGQRLSEQRRQIQRRLECEGEENGLRLLNLFARRLGSLDMEIRDMSPKDVARQRHPSRMNAQLNEFVPLLDAWKKDPASIESQLAEEENGAAARAEARLRAMKKHIDRISKDGV